MEQNRAGFTALCGYTRLVRGLQCSGIFCPLSPKIMAHCLPRTLQQLSTQSPPQESHCFPAQAQRKRSIRRQRDTAAAPLPSDSALRSRSQSSAEGLGPWRQRAAQTSAGSQLPSGIGSNINMKSRWCTAFLQLYWLAF